MGEREGREDKQRHTVGDVRGVTTYGRSVQENKRTAVLMAMGD